MALPIWRILALGTGGAVAVAGLVIAIDPDILARLRGEAVTVAAPGTDAEAEARVDAAVSVTEPEPAETAAATDSEAGTSGEIEEPVPPVAVPLPSFDVVRIEPDGGGLVAGQAEPGEAVALILDGAEMQRVESDAQGRFVAFLDLEPSEAPRTLALLADPDGTARRSDETVIVSPFGAPEAGGEAVALAAPGVEGTAPEAPAPSAQPSDAELSDAPPLPAQADAADSAEAAEVAAADLPLDPEALAEAPAAPEPAPPVDAATQAPAPASGDETPERAPDRLAISTDGGEAPVVPQEPAEVSAVAPEELAEAPDGDQPLALGETRDGDQPVAVAETPDGDQPAAVAEAASEEASGAPETGDAPASADVDLLAEAPALSAPEIGSVPIAEPAEGEGPDRMAAADLPEIAPPGPEPDPDRTTAPAPDGSEAVPPEETPVPPEASAPEPPAGAPSVIVADSAGVRVLQPATGGEPAPDVMSNVALDTITYDPEGEVLLGGRAASGGFVQVYIDNAPVSTSRIAEDGQWRLELPQIDTGVYTLRVDELDAAGEVLSRIETPFLREAPDTIARVMAEETSRAGFSVAVRTVQPGNTLWAIAEERYGEGILYVRVFDANRDLIRDPDLIYPGQVFRLPEAEDG